MIREQVLILKVKFDDELEKTPPHTWNWGELLNSSHEVEVLNHGSAEESK